MLIDPDSLRISALVDLEFTNAMPAQFAYDPPWWLLLSGPESWLDRGAMDEFVACYEPRMEWFLRALERVEGESRLPVGIVVLLSLPECACPGRRWVFDSTMRRGRVSIDVVYWAAMHHEDGGDGGEQPQPSTRPGSP